MKEDKDERERGTERGFTLIEIMVVVMIIGLLSSIVTVGVIRTLRKAKRSAAATQIRQYSLALAHYYLDNSRYPTTSQCLAALVEKPSLPPAPKNYPKSGYLSEKKLRPDPWGNDYVYVSPGTDGSDFSIVSYGEDGADGGEDYNADIKSWDLPAE